MNNLRLLTASLLLSAGLCVVGQNVITLEEIFEYAEANSAQLRPAISSIEEARREIDVAKAGRLPDINSSLTLSYIGNGFTTARDFTNLHSAPIPHFGSGLSIGVSQPVYSGGAITHSIELAELKLTAARFAADLNRDNIRFRLAGFYLDIYKYTNLRSVVESNIESAKKMLKDMTVRFEQGTVLRNDITRYELLLSNLELELVRINNTLKILNTNLVTIAGLDSSTVIMPDSTILSRSLPGHGEGWWLSEAENNASSISLARAEVDICRKSESLVNADRYPKVGLQAGWTLEGPILVEVPPINRNLSYWYVGVGVSYNISSLYKNNRSLNKAKAAVVHSVNQLDAVRENVSLAVRGDYVRYLEAYEELLSRDKAVELADRNYQTTSTRYNAGMALITDLLDAADARLDAQQQRVNARINIIYYYYKLLFTSGKI